MSVSFASDPDCTPGHVALPSSVVARYRVRSTLAAESTRVQYDLDPSGPVMFAGGGFTRAGQTTIATAGGTLFSDPLPLAGQGASGSMIVISVTITGADGLSQVAPAFLEII